jgi:hypothetical protein
VAGGDGCPDLNAEHDGEDQPADKQGKSIREQVED